MVEYLCIVQGWNLGLKIDFLHLHCNGNRMLNTNDSELPERRERQNLQKEVLAALFTTSVRHEDLPPISKAKSRPVRKSRVAGNLVTEPFEEFKEHHINDLFSMHIQEDGKHSVPYLISLWKVEWEGQLPVGAKIWASVFLFPEIAILILRF